MTLPTLPPGTILQLMYLKEKIKNIKQGYFLEVGCGIGIISNILLERGWSGIGIDLNTYSLNIACEINSTYLKQEKYTLVPEDFFKLDLSKTKFDLIISCMVLEHFDSEKEILYLQRAKSILNPNGKIILLLPSCPKYWGIEDEIAGHYRRYTFSSIRKKLLDCGYRVDDIAGLTYPLSNWLYPLSNYLVRRQEYSLRNLSMQEKTKRSGYRNVKFKTVFPSIMKVFLNEFVLYPFHILQKINRSNSQSLVLYAEGTTQ